MSIAIYNSAKCLADATFNVSQVNFVEELFEISA
jgi:hypothetical protein